MLQSDEAMPDCLQRAAFDYFPQHTNPHNGLVADTTRAGSPSSIAVVGFALSAYPVAVERGWTRRDVEFGLDQGLIILMIENYRSGLLWRLSRGCSYVQAGLRRAGFRGGWL